MSCRFRDHKVGRGPWSKIDRIKLCSQMREDRPPCIELRPQRASRGGWRGLRRVLEYDFLPALPDSKRNVKLPVDCL
jgi:hypothetical protein